MASTYTCSCCGKQHDGLPTDWGFQRPDEVHAFGYLERYRRVRLNADLCTLDEHRHFLRGVLPVPLSEDGDDFAWGVWVEVDRATHDAYVATFDDESPDLPVASGRIANTITGYSETVGLPVEVRFNGGSQRPALRFADDLLHGLAHEQRAGISRKRHHDILGELGFFDEPVADD